MADPVRGTLTWRDRRPLVVFPTRRGISIPTPVPAGHLADELTKPQPEPREVELELEGGQPRRVRPIGAAWTAAAAQPPLPAPPNRPGRTDPNRREHRPEPPPQRGWEAAFHNPYGFVRAPDRKRDHPELGDLGEKMQPPSHSWYDHERWTGRIRVKLTVETPLLLPDAAEVKKDSNGHKTYPVRLGPDGRPYLPPTSIKGMLRSAYETVTNSRFGIFTGHDRRLGFRMDAREGLGMVPGRVVGDRLELLTGTNPELPQHSERGWQVPRGIMYAAWLPRYRDERFNIRYADRKFPRHGEPVRFWAELIRHRSGRFSFWEVRRIARADEGLAAAPPPRAGGQVRDFTGWVCTTNQNINRKHDERVFFADPQAARVRHCPLTESMKKAWQDLIAEYRSLHQGEIDRRDAAHQRPDQYLGHEPGKTAFSRHVYGAADRELADGALVYVRLDSDREATAVSPVMISRELHPNAPADLLEHSLKPAERIEELSLADRVFGWVNPQGTGAYRGNLRVGPVRCETADAVKTFASPLPLAILGQPKPNQARFYLAAANGTALNGQPVQGAYRKDTNRLQGRKAYPHHAQLDAAHWDDAEHDHTQDRRANGAYQEYRRAGAAPADDQNRSVKGWVKPGSTFAFDIHITNLSDVELGALLWLLDLPADGNRRRFHRLGGGKPLGFGSVRLETTESELAQGGEWARYYKEFDLDPPKVADKARLAVAVEAFRTAVADAYGDGQLLDQVSFIADFLTAAEGFHDGRQIHYPRITPQPSIEGENFRWFQENEHRTRSHRAALAALAEDRGLPEYRAAPGPGH